MNTYGYGYQNPLYYIDPFGLTSLAGCANPANAAACAAAGVNTSRASGAVNTAGVSLWCLITGTCMTSDDFERGGDCGATDLPNLTGLAPEEADEMLDEHGFIPKPSNHPGKNYNGWKHPDGSEVWIDSGTGGVDRLGPKYWKPDGSGKQRDRIDKNGEVIPHEPDPTKRPDSHHQGENLKI